MEWLHLAKADLPCTAQPPQAVLRSHHSPITPPDPGTPRDGSDTHSRTPESAPSHLKLAAYLVLLPTPCLASSTTASHPYRSWMTPPCQCPTLYPVPKAKVTTAFLPRSSLPPEKRSLPPPARKPARRVPPPQLLVLGPPGSTQSSLPAPQGSRGLSRAPPPQSWQAAPGAGVTGALGLFVTAPNCLCPRRGFEGE